MNWACSVWSAVTWPPWGCVEAWLVGTSVGRVGHAVPVPVIMPAPWEGKVHVVGQLFSGPVSCMPCVLQFVPPVPMMKT